MRNFFAFLIAVAIIFSVAACGDDNAKTYNPFTVKGMVAKGPLVKGSTIYFTILSESGEQEGLILNATTDDDLGRFAYKVTADVAPKVVGKVCKISATGYFYDEIADRLSNAPISLEALFRITDTDIQDARINLLTHMTVKRTLELMDSGIIFEDAQAQAESELIDQMGVFYSPAGEDPKPAIEMDITTDPYPLAIACIFNQAAYNIAKDDDEFYGKYQQLLNDTSADLTDGTLTANTKGIILAGETNLDAATCAANLQKYLEEKTGDTFTLPDPNASVDSDNDGIPNETDPDLDNDGILNEMDCVNGTTDYLNIVVLYGNYFCVQNTDLSWKCKDFAYGDMGSIGQESWNRNFSQVVSGDNMVCGLENSKIWCWYDTVLTSMIQTNNNDWSNLYAGKNRLCGISDTDGFLYCWQEDLTAEPIKANEDSWLSISLGNEKIWGIKSDNTLWNWNYNETPVQISSEQWKSFSRDSLYAIKEDGTIWYLGNESLPVQIDSNTDWKLVVGTCGVKTDNTTWCWEEDSSVPIQQIGFGWSCGEWSSFYHVTNPSYTQNYCGQKSDHSIWCSSNGILTNVP